METGALKNRLFQNFSYFCTLKNELKIDEVTLPMDYGCHIGNDIVQ